MHADFEMFVGHVYYGITHIDLYISFLWNKFRGYVPLTCTLYKK